MANHKKEVNQDEIRLKKQIGYESISSFINLRIYGYPNSSVPEIHT